MGSIPLPNAVPRDVYENEFRRATLRPRLQLVAGHRRNISHHYTHIETSAKRAALKKLPKLLKSASGNLGVESGANAACEWASSRATIQTWPLMP